MAKKVVKHKICAISKFINTNLKIGFKLSNIETSKLGNIIPLIV